MPQFDALVNGKDSQCCRGLHGGWRLRRLCGLPQHYRLDVVPLSRSAVFCKAVDLISNENGGPFQVGMTMNFMNFRFYVFMLVVCSALGLTLQSLMEIVAAAAWEPQAPVEGGVLDPPRLAEPIVGIDGSEYLTEEERRNIAVHESSVRSVVHIATQAIQIDRFFGTESEEASSGSGVVLDQAGHVLTNFHVIEGADRLTVTLFNGAQYEATLVGQDPPNDMAVLRIDAPQELLFPVQLGQSSNLRVGQKVYAFGSPFGLERTMTVGVVSGLGRSVPTHSHRVLKSMIQVDAALNRGNSGGPLMDSRGLLVGMNTAIATRTGENTGVGFAIPVDTIGRVAALLIRDGRVVRPSLGISAYIQAEDGLLIGQVVPGGPAEKAGLRGVQVVMRRSYFGTQRFVDFNAADRILAVEGQPVKNVDDLMSVIETLQPGQEARLTVLRGGEATGVPIVLGQDTDP